MDACCAECGEYFEAREEWQKLCWPCWKERQGYESTSTRTTNSCIQCGDHFEAKGAWQKLCWDCWKKSKEDEHYARGYDRGYLDATRNQSISSNFDPAFLTDLIALCHPDRHEGRVEKATRVTQILLEMRAKSKR